MKNLESNIKEKNFCKIYLIFGEEDYLKNSLQKKLISSAVPKDFEMMNFALFEGKNANISEMIDACDTMPFMSEHRLVIVKNSGLFAEGRKNDSEKIAEYLRNIPDTTILAFIEEKVDKRQKLFKEAKKLGSIHEINSFSENELVSFIINIFKEAGKNIGNKEAIYIIRTVGVSMESLTNEMNKLISYKEAEKDITIDDINKICTKSIESRIFDLIDVVANKNLGSALDIYKNLIFNKTSPFLVLNMMARQFRIILQVKYLNSKNYNHFDIAKELGLRDFMVREALKQSKTFSNKELLKAINDCLDTDNKIKTGVLPDEMAVEMLIIKYAGS